MENQGTANPSAEKFSTAAASTLRDIIGESEKDSYTITITVTKKELDDANYGSLDDEWRLVDKVIQEAKKLGYKEI